MKLKRFLALFTVICMVFSMMPVSAFAVQRPTDITDISVNMPIDSPAPYKQEPAGLPTSANKLLNGEEEGGPDHDDEGPLDISDYTASIGETGYETLAAAVAASSAGDEIRILKAGTYSFVANSGITVTGAVDGVVFDCTAGGSIASNLNDVTVKNVTFNMGQSTYHGFQHSEGLVFQNCTFNGLFFSYGSMAFTGCTFNQTNAEYIMWIYGGPVDFTNCVFNAKGKILNVYRETSAPCTLTMTSCTFNSSVLNKSAVNVKETCGTIVLNNTVTITDCTIGTPEFFPTNMNGGSQIYMVDDLVGEGVETGTLVKLGNTQVWPAVDYVAMIGEQGYESLAAAVAAVTAGTETTIVMIKDEEINSNAGINISAGKNIILDLNGQKITGNAPNASVSCLITNNGTLKIKDSLEGGSLEFTAAQPSANNGYSSSAIINYGTLDILSGKVENLSSGGASYAIDNYAGTLTISGGTVKAKATSVRLAMFNSNSQTVNVTGGAITSLNGYGLQMFECSTGASAVLNVSGGTITGADIAFYAYSYNKYGEKMHVNISGGTFNGDTAFTGAMAADHITVSGGNLKNVYSYGDADKFITGGTIDLSGHSYWGYLTEAQIANYSAPWNEVAYWESQGYIMEWSDYYQDYEIYYPAILDKDDLPIADGYKLKDLGNDIYEVVPKTYEAKIGDTKYETLADAVAEAENADVIEYIGEGTETLFSVEYSEMAFFGSPYAVFLAIDEIADDYVIPGNILADLADAGAQKAGNTVELLVTGDVTIDVNGYTESEKLAGMEHMLIVSGNRDIQGHLTLVNTGNDTAFPIELQVITEGATVNDQAGLYTATITTGSKTVYYQSLADAAAAAKADVKTTIVMIANETIEVNNGVQISAGKNIVLDLNGKTVSQNAPEASASYLIENRGTLEIKDGIGNGKLTALAQQPDTSYGYGNYTIENFGTLTVTSGIIENTTTGAGAYYALDTREGATATINGGKLVSDSITIRQVSFGDAENTLTINGGDITGGYFTIQTFVMTNGMHSHLNITGGTITTTDDYYNLAYYMSKADNVSSIENVFVNISGGVFYGDAAFTELAKAENLAVSGGVYYGDYGVYSYDTSAKFITGGIYWGTYWSRFIKGDKDRVMIGSGDYAGMYTVGEKVTALTFDYAGARYIAYFGGIREAVSFAEEYSEYYSDYEITLLKDEVIAGNDGVTVPSGLALTLDLNGKTLSNSVNENRSSQVILNQGTLIIIDSSDEKSGVIINAVAEGTAPGSWWTTPQYNYATNVITNLGTLTVNGGEIYETAASTICYAIDNNSNTGNAILTVNGGYIHQDNATAIRMFCNSTAFENTVNVNGGVIDGGYTAVWVQLPGNSGQAKKAALNITGGTLRGGTYAFYDYSFGDVFTNVAYSITGGTFEGDILINADTASITAGSFLTCVNDGNADKYITGGIFDLNGESYLGYYTPEEIESFDAPWNTVEYWESQGYRLEWTQYGDYDIFLPRILTKDDLPIADGYKLKDLGENRYEVVPCSYIAKIGSKKYETLAEAVKAANNGDVIEYFGAGTDTLFSVEYSEMAFFGSPYAVFLAIDETADDYIIPGNILADLADAGAQKAGNTVEILVTGDVTIDVNGYTESERLAGMEHMLIVSGNSEIQGHLTLVNTGSAADFPIELSRITAGATVTDNAGLYTAIITDGDTAVYYRSLADAVAAAEAGTKTTIVMIANETLVANNGVLIPAGKDIILDLNGKTVSQTAPEARESYLIENRGTLEIKDGIGNGKLTALAQQPDTSYGYGNYTIENFGTLTVTSGIIENTTTGAGAYYALDTREGATATINGGKLVSDSITVRQASFGSAENTLTIAGGEIEAGFYGIQTYVVSGDMHSHLNISGGKITSTDTSNNLAVYLCAYNTNFENVYLDITGGTFYGNVAASGSSKAENLSVSNGVFYGRYGVYSYDTTAQFITGGIYSGTYWSYFLEDGLAMKQITSGDYAGMYTVGEAVAALSYDYDGYRCTEVFASLEDAVACAYDYAIDPDPSMNQVITMLKNETITGNAGVTIPAGLTVTLDLNGKTVSQIAPDAKASYLIENRGTLEVIDSSTGGKLTALAQQPDTSYGYGNYTVENFGTLTVTSGIIENTTTGAGAYYAIDTREGAVANIDGGTVTSKSITIRQASFGSAENTLNINGGVIESGYFAVQTYVVTGDMHSHLNISGGTITTTDTQYDLAVYVCAYNSNFDNVFVNITGGTFNGDVAIAGAAKTENLKVSGGVYYGDYGVYSYNDDAQFITGGIYKGTYWSYFLKEGLVMVGIGSGEYAGMYTVGEAVVTLSYDYDGGRYTEYFAGLADAVECAKNYADNYGCTGLVITMLKDETIAGNDGVTVPAGLTVTLDLNGKTLSNSVNENRSSQVITNKGSLTITDSSEAGTGMITNAVEEGTAAGEWWGTTQYNYATNVITNCGTLTINGGKLYETAASSICYAIDNNSTTGNAVININGGTIDTLAGTAVRQYCNSTTFDNTVNMTGGTVEGGATAIWVQLPGQNGDAKKATLNVSGGTLKGGTYAFYDYSYGDVYTNVNYNLTGGTFDGVIFSYGANVSISGGTYKDDVAIKQTAPSTVSVTGGKFSGDVYTYGASASTGFIAGGVYAIDTYVEDGETYACDWTLSTPSNLCKVVNTDPDTKDAYPWTVGKAVVTIRTTSGTETGTASIAVVSGGGDYRYDSDVTLTTTLVQGYSFVGWQVSTDNGTTFTPVEGATSTTYTFKASVDATYKAVYAVSADLQLKVTGTKFTVNGSTQRSVYTYTFPAGTYVTVEYKGPEEFLYWGNESGKIMSTSSTYTVPLVTSMTLNAYFNRGDAESNEAYVIFESGSAQVLASRYYTDSEDIVFPSPIARKGKIFSGWSMTQDQIHAAMAENQYIIVTPVYVSDGNTYNVDVEYVIDGNVSIKESISNVVDSGSRYIAEAPVIDGYCFRYWKLGDTIVSYSTSFGVTGRKDITYTAVYGTEMIDPQAAIAVYSTFRDMNGERPRVNISFTYSVPEGCTVEVVGAVRTAREEFANAEILIIENADPINAAIKTSTASNITGAYTAEFNMSSKDARGYYRGFLTYSDGDGLHTIYTPVYSFCWNEFED